MNRYLVVSPHTQEDCAKAIKIVEAASGLTRWDWGCKDGEHCGWVVVEAESNQQALLVVPPLERHKARAIKLVRFTPEEIRAMHA
ncbi:MAG: hypothetical protein L0Y80_07485 [Ignavibacteriae bacterium]|nr:hypothetical protein [Ignavibacteriota bacterium]